MNVGADIIRPQINTMFRFMRADHIRPYAQFSTGRCKCGVKLISVGRIISARFR